MNYSGQNTTPFLQDLFIHYKVCILLPTYNNDKTLGRVIEECLQQTSHVIVINDGSTDNSTAIIDGYAVQSVSYQNNRGKGYALRKGFDYALSQGYQYAISIDTDGQHFPGDCKLFMDKLKASPGALIIGARNLNQENVPGKSSFGNKFSNFWFRLETGIDMPDTQSGFRLYPIFMYKEINFYTSKFEFEIEVIVRSSWMGIPILAIPVSVYYPKKEDRISHFRPFKDFLRISVLNTILVLVLLFYIKPRDLLFKPLKQKGIKKGLKELLFNPNESSKVRALSAGFGVFMGIVPIWGFQLLVGIPLAVLMKMNKTLFILAANISIFPPVIWAASLATGKWIYHNPNWKIKLKGLTWEEVVQTGKEFFVGGLVLAIVSGICTFLLVYLLLFWRTKYKNSLNILK